jgi:hypothetical protein
LREACGPEQRHADRVVPVDPGGEKGKAEQIVPKRIVEAPVLRGAADQPFETALDRLLFAAARRGQQGCPFAVVGARRGPPEGQGGSAGHFHADAGPALGSGVQVKGRAIEKRQLRPGQQLLGERRPQAGFPDEMEEGRRS